MKVSTDDSRRYPNDDSWGLGIWYFGWDESSIDLNLGFRSFTLSWQRSRPPTTIPFVRLFRFITDPTWGLGVFRFEGTWSLSIGPWLWEGPTAAELKYKGVIKKGKRG